MANQNSTAVINQGRELLAKLAAPTSEQVRWEAEKFVTRYPESFLAGPMYCWLLRQGCGPEIGFAAETFLIQHCLESDVADELLSVLLAKGSSLSDEWRLLAVLDDVNSYGLILALLRRKPRGVVLRIAKKYMRRYRGSPGSAFLLKALLRTRKLSNERKWVDLWLASAEERHIPLMIEIFCGYFDRPKPSKHAVSLARRMAGSTTPKDIYAIRMLLYYERSGKTRKWVTGWARTNLNKSKTESIITELAHIFGDDEAVDLAMSWLSQTPPPKFASVCSVLRELLWECPTQRVLSFARCWLDEQPFAAELQDVRAAYERVMALSR